jgi:hypothetical protein
VGDGFASLVEGCNRTTHRILLPLVMLAGQTSPTCRRTQANQAPQRSQTTQKRILDMHLTVLMPSRQLSSPFSQFPLHLKNILAKSRDPRSRVSIWDYLEDMTVARPRQHMLLSFENLEDSQRCSSGSRLNTPQCPSSLHVSSNPRRGYLFRPGPIPQYHLQDKSRSM